MHLFSILTSHCLVLIYVAGHPQARVWEIAREVDLTERRIADILRDLVEAGYLRSERDGRRNRYTVREDMKLEHPLVSEVPIGPLLSMVAYYQAQRPAEPGNDGTKPDLYPDALPRDRRAYSSVPALSSR